MEIADIKSQLTLAQVLDHYGLKPDKHGKLNCPFHEDKTPSFQVYYKTHTCYCFSSNCPTNGKSLDVIDFIMYKEKTDKHNAILKAQSLIGGESTPALGREVFLTRMFTYFKNAVYNAKTAQGYITGRSLDFNAIEVGYNAAQFHHGNRKDETLIKNCVQYGLLKPTNRMNGRDKESNVYTVFGKYCIVFALKNKSNQVSGLYFRSTINDTDQKHFYLKDRQGLYPCYPNAETKKLILTEAIIDAATLLQVEAITANYTVLSCYGTNGFTEEHQQAIQSLEQLEEVIFFFDGDEAGKKAVAKYSELLKQLKPNIKITSIHTPEGEDVNSLAQSHNPEIFIHLLAQRNSLSFSTETCPAHGGTKETRSAILTPEPDKQSKLHTDNPELLFYENGVLNITVLGGIRITGLDKLRVTLKLETKIKDHAVPLRHNLDLYNKIQVDQLCSQAVETLELSTGQAIHALAGLTTALEKYREARLELLKPKKEEKRKLNEEEKREALDYLKSPDLIKHTSQDIASSGIVGEKVNNLIAYLAYTSRKREKPLHLMCLGASGVGKTYLQEKISQLIPEEDKLEITTLSENAFYYFGQEELKHKLILIEDLDGAENVLYPLRELQSKTSISKTVTLKDNKGNLKTITLKVEGPVSVSSCTTREKLYEDNANRCILLYIDSSAEQDKRILEHQQKTSAGLINRHEESKIREKLKNVQRLLRPIVIRNPYAPYINLPESVFKPRRTMLLLLSFVETITFYHQYQRVVKQDQESGELYIESTVQDIDFAFKLLKEVLFSKSDELTGACRRFFEQLKTYLKKEKQESFYSAAIRKSLRLNPNNLKRYLIELSRHGYIKITAGSKYKGYQYEVTEVSEYDELKSSIDGKLEEILLTIRAV